MGFLQDQLLGNSFLCSWKKLDFSFAAKVGWNYAADRVISLNHTSWYPRFFLLKFGFSKFWEYLEFFIYKYNFKFGK